MADEDAPDTVAVDMNAQENFDNPIAKLVNSRVWGSTFLMLIFANTVTMAMYRPTEQTDSPHNQMLEDIEFVFLVLFTVEIVLKLTGLKPKGFFSDNWNTLDFFIVGSGYLHYLPGLGNMVNTSVFRTIRVLRPLRSIGMMPGVRVLIDALFMSLPGLSSVFILIIFAYTVFSVMGVQLFQGSFLYHCTPVTHCAMYGGNTSYMEYGDCIIDDDCAGYANSTAMAMNSTIADANITFVCANATAESMDTSIVYAGEYDFCSPDPERELGCAPNYECTRTTGIYHSGATCFDNTPQAVLILFQMTTTEGWTSIMEPTLHMNEPFVVYVYFISLLFVTSFFLMNFILAQMVVAFSRAVALKESLRAPDPSTVDIIIRKIKIAFCAGGAAALGTDIWAMRALFNAVDEDGSGFLDGDEVSALAGKLDMKLSIEDMDNDADGTVEYKEFENWWKMRREFDTFDEDGGGSLSPDEIEKLASKLQVDVTIAEMDTTEDGTVDYAEFVAWWNLSRMFNALDTSGDGTLDKDELSVMCKSLQITPIISIMANIGTDEDGNVSFFEFQVWWLMWRAFGQLDTDGSGTLDESEVQILGEKLNMELHVRDIAAKEDLENGDVTFDVFAKWWAKTGKDKKAILIKETQALAAGDGPGGLKGLVLGGPFNNVVLAVVMLNFLVLSLDHHGISHGLVNIIEGANMVFTIFFAIEMVMKIAGLGVLMYLDDTFNILDGFIVITSLVELLMGSSGAMSSIRTLRLLRVVRSVRVFSQIDSMRRLLEATMRMGPAIFNFAVLLFFFLVIYALIGMNAFGTDFVPPVDSLGKPLYGGLGRFDSFYYSFLTVFQVLTRENWHDLLYIGFSAAGWPAFLYFGTLIIITNYMILSLFLGNLLHNLQMVFLAEAKAMARKAAASNAKARAKMKEKGSKRGSSQSVTASIALGPLTIDPDASQEEKERIATLIIQKAWAKFMTRKCDLPEPGSAAAGGGGRSMMIFGADSGLRTSFTTLVNDPVFDGMILFAILISSLTLAYEHPADNAEDNPTKVVMLFAIDVTLTGLFIVEMLLKIISQGFVLGEGTYLKDGWNAMDFIVILASIVGLLPAGKKFKSLRIIRTFRIVRPLRAMSRLPGLRAITEAIFKSLLPICIVGAISIFVSTIFAVTFVALQKGKLYSCSEDPDPQFDPPVYFTGTECIAMGGTYDQSSSNMDNTPSALLKLFEIMTLEDWQNHMYASMDTTDTDSGIGDDTFMRTYRGDPKMGVLYMIFVLTGSFFFLNLFLGVVANAFDVAGNRENVARKKAIARSKRRQAMMGFLSPFPASGWFTAVRKPCYEIARSTIFEVFIAFAIILNVLIMATEHAEQDQDFTDTLAVLNYVFTIIFVFELLVKIVALNPARCFKDNWNTFDLIVVGLSVMEIVLTSVADKLPLKPSVFRAFRVIRLTRLLKLVPHSKGLQLIFQTVIEALPFMGSVAILLTIVFFVYSVLAVQLFGLVQPGDGEMNDLMNFTSFPRAWWTLFVAATGEHWNALMHELKEAEDGPGAAATIIFFLTFQFLCVFLTLNLFISVVVATVQEAEEGEFEKRQSGEEEPEELDWHHLDMFLFMWVSLDPEGSGFIEGEGVMQTLLDACEGSPIVPGRVSDVMASVEDMNGVYDFQLFLTRVVNIAYHDNVAEVASPRKGNATPVRKSGDNPKFINPMLDEEGGEEEGGNSDQED